MKSGGRVGLAAWWSRSWPRRPPRPGCTLAWLSVGPRRAWVIGSGLDVWEIVEMLDSYADDRAALTADHPLVTERHVRTARAYAAQFAREIDGQLAENRRPESELADLYPFLQQPRR